jgi:hypothetical protein
MTLVILVTLGRTILALLIALSVAVLPAAGAGAAVVPAQTGDMAATADMPDCCPSKANPCDQSTGDCGSMAACALKCFGFSNVSLSIVAFPVVAASLSTWAEDHSFRSRPGSAPFRPPRS